MPSTITHAYFAIDILNKLNKNQQDFLTNETDLLKVTAQSMDPLGFYDVLKPYKRKSKKIRSISGKFHKTKTGKYLITLTKYIKESNYQNNPKVIAYLYGIIAHYVLDSTVHPFVIYKTGVFKPDKLETYKYNSKHLYMEQYFDEYMIEKKENIKAKKFKCHKDFIKVNKLDIDLKNTIDFSFEKVYNIDNFSDIYLKAIQDMHFVIKNFRYDPYGIMKFFYYIFDFVMPKKVLSAKFLSYNFKSQNYKEFLNSEHKIWHYAADENITSNESFEDLYEKALKKATLIINEINNYLYQNKEVDLNKIYGNLSYTTGLNLELKKYSYFYEY